MTNSEGNELLKKTTKGVFWSYDFDNLDYLRDKNLIIEQIIEAGLQNDEVIMWKLYTYNEIKEVALNMESLLYEKLVYMSFVLELDMEEFRCYKKKQ
jgi:hypothetical protein